MLFAQGHSGDEKQARDGNNGKLIFLPMIKLGVALWGEQKEGRGQVCSVVSGGSCGQLMLDTEAGLLEMRFIPHV